MTGRGGEVEGSGPDESPVGEELPFLLPVPPGLELHSVLAHDELAEWIGPMLSRWNVWTALWKVASFGGLLALGALGGWFVAAGVIGVGALLLQVGLGLVGALLLVAPHEALHALAYRWVGARNVGFGADWRRLVFHCTAHGFVADLPAFRRVALLPCVTVTGAALGAALLVPVEWILLPLTLVVAHFTFCAGDFALLGYLHDHREQGMQTVDDVESGTTAFLVETAEANG
ncbi:MAG: DUF3267 domain-containing protein [Gemmatimonadales bacterium]|nr:MAG: DUF3267 domain-containing protein [Gemmatimonadales bacterium]